MDGVGKGLDISAATELVSKAWADVFTTSNLVIKHSGLYGFNGIELIPNPNIHQMLASMNVVSDMLNRVIENLGYIDLDHDSTRKLLNAKQQIVRLERVAAALVAKDEDLYNEAIAEVCKQAVV